MSANSNIRDLLDSWIVNLAAERKTEATRDLYRDGLLSFFRYCEGRHVAPVLSRPLVNAWVASLLDSGLSPATARARQLAVRRFSRWLAAEGEIDADELIGLSPPKLDTKIVPELTEDELKSLITACRGKELRDRRDEAIVRLMMETGARAGEVVALRLGDVDVKTGIVFIHRGKGGRGRTIPIGPVTARAIDRYLRIRKGHRLAHTERLWVGERGREFGYDGLYVALRRRAELAGIKNFHPHLMRHTAAHRWLAAGGSEGGLMAMAGWKRRDMLDRYAAHGSERRAAEEARRLNLGDL
jgi:integrase/recombinase XerD